MNFAHRARAWDLTEAYASRTIGNGRGLVGRHLDERQRETGQEQGERHGDAESQSDRRKYFPLLDQHVSNATTSQ